MPMSDEDKKEKVQRLRNAHKKTEEVLTSEPLTWELHLGTHIAQNWPVVTAAYSGLEQTLKFLIAEQRELTISELLDLEKNTYRTHNLSWLFSKLEEAVRSVVLEF